VTTPSAAAARRTDTFHAALAGVVTAVVGFSSSFAVVIAGLLTLRIAPFRDLAKSPAAIGTMIAVWAVMAVLLPRWAVPAALVVVLAETALSGGFARGASLQPQLVWITPAWTPQAMLAIALPLYLVTMTSQNIPGVSVMASLGYAVPLRPALAYTGLATSAGALFGGHAINLSAIAAALAAGEEAGRDRSRRWIAALF
jgi:benzoate membrane transport protein